MRKFLFFSLLVFSLKVYANDEDYLKQHANLYKKVTPSIVGIRATAQRGSYFGTGTFISKDGYILTSVTVVPENASNIKIYLPNKKIVKARLVGIDKKTEVSLLKIENNDCRFLEFSQKEAEVGDLAYTIGNAYNSIDQDFQPSICYGIISGRYEIKPKGESVYEGEIIETTAAVNPGVDGGPLINSDGKIIGLVCLGYSESRWLGTSIPVSIIKPVVEKLIKNDKKSQAINKLTLSFIGFDVEEDSRHIKVSDVKNKTAAFKAGIKKDDIILEVNGKKVRSKDELIELFGSFKAGSSVIIKVKRGTEEKTLQLVIPHKTI